LTSWTGTPPDVGTQVTFTGIGGTVTGRVTSVEGGASSWTATLDTQPDQPSGEPRRIGAIIDELMQPAAVPTRYDALPAPLTIEAVHAAIERIRGDSIHSTARDSVNWRTYLERT